MSRYSELTVSQLQSLVENSLFVKEFSTDEYGTAYNICKPSYEGKAKILYESCRAEQTYEAVASSVQVANNIACYAVSVHGGYQIAVVMPANEEDKVDFERWEDFIAC